MLTRMLNSHSKIAAPYEIPVAQMFFGTDKENLLLDKTIQICELLEIDVKRGVAEPDFLFESILAAENKDTLVVKEPSNAMHLPRIRALFGDVPLVWIVRDVRQMMQSKAFRSSGVGQVEAARRWFRHNSQIQKYSRLFSRIVRIKYEDLVAEPQKELHSLIDWMGFEFEPDMEEFWRFEHSDHKLALWDGNKPEESTWAKELTEGRINQNYKAPPPDVLKIYNSSPNLMRLNRQLGYDTPSA